MIAVQPRERRRVTDADHMARALGAGRTRPRPDQPEPDGRRRDRRRRGRGRRARRARVRRRTARRSPCAERRRRARARGHALLHARTLQPHRPDRSLRARVVADAGIRRAVDRDEDPNPLVSGRGIALLRDNGVESPSACWRRRGARLNRPFVTVMRQHRPFVTIKAAVSADGKVAAGAGGADALTGTGAIGYIHRERAEVDAIGVGSGTILADDPLLTPRIAYRQRPLVRVIFDRRLRTPASARAAFDARRGPGHNRGRGRLQRRERAAADALETAGARLEPSAVRCRETGPLRPALARLTESGGESLVVEEGRPSIAASGRPVSWTGGAGREAAVRRGMPPILARPASPAATGREWRGQRLGMTFMIKGYVHRAD